MYIHQSLLKKQLQDSQLFRTEYNGQNTENIATILAQSYMDNIEIFGVLNYDYDELYQEFEIQLIDHSYKWILVYHVQSFGNINYSDIVGTVSYSDIKDVQLTKQEQQIKNLDIVSDPTQVKYYCRLKALKFFFDNYNPNLGRYCIGGSLAISSKYKGRNLSLKILADSFEFMLSKGYQYIVGWTPFEIAKKIYDKLHHILREEQSLENFYIEKSQTYVFRKKKIIQVLYIFDVHKSLIKLKDIILKNNQERSEIIMNL